MNDKIKAIIEAKGLTPSRFADEIGVPRPIVSHILAGRNKPSLDMVQKIIRRFPELGTEWILDENALPNGVMEVRSEINVVASKNPPTEQPPRAEQRRMAGQPVTANAPVALPEEAPKPAEMPKAVETPPPMAQVSKNTQRVFVFYADKTFDEYNPST